MEQTQGYCPNCRVYVLATREGMNHVLHLLLSVFLCGLWLPMWVLLTIVDGATATYQCGRCGSVTSSSGPAAVRPSAGGTISYLLYVVFLLALIGGALWAGWAAVSLHWPFNPGGPVDQFRGAAH
jgi:hypothetical protein